MGKGDCLREFAKSDHCKAPAAPVKPAAPAADAKVAEFQKGLKFVGYDPGRRDGVMDDNTRAAIKKFQQDMKVSVTGTMDSASQAAMATAIKAVLAANMENAKAKGIVDKGKAEAAKVVAEKAKAEATAKAQAEAAAKAQAAAEAEKDAKARAAVNEYLGVSDSSAATTANATIPLGSASGTASRARNGFDKAKDVAIGVGKGIGDLTLESAKGLVLPAYEIYQKGKALKEGYEQGDGGVRGVWDAVNNAANPAYHALVDGYETEQAVERGDFEAAGRHGLHAGNDGVQTVMLAKGGAEWGASKLAGGGAPPAPPAGSGPSESTTIPENGAPAKPGAEPLFDPPLTAAEVDEAVRPHHHTTPITDAEIDTAIGNAQRGDLHELPGYVPEKILSPEAAKKLGKPKIKELLKKKILHERTVTKDGKKITEYYYDEEGLKDVDIRTEPDAPIQYHENLNFKNIKDAPHRDYELRTHSANENAPEGTYSRDNTTTQYNSKDKYGRPIIEEPKKSLTKAEKDKKLGTGEPIPDLRPDTVVKIGGYKKLPERPQPGATAADIARIERENAAGRANGTIMTEEEISQAHVHTYPDPAPPAKPKADPWDSKRPSGHGPQVAVDQAQVQALKKVVLDEAQELYNEIDAPASHSAPKAPADPHADTVPANPPASPNAPKPPVADERAHAKTEPRSAKPANATAASSPPPSGPKAPPAKPPIVAKDAPTGGTNPPKPAPAAEPYKPEPPTPLPADNAVVTIKTRGGPKQITAGHYRDLVEQARNWVSKRRLEYKYTGGKEVNGPEPVWTQLAEEEFNLDPGWDHINNPITYGKL